MTRSVDQRVVEMTFDNAQFEKGVGQTLSSLDELDRKLSLKNTGSFSGEMDEAAASVENIAEAYDNLQASRSGIASTVMGFAQGLTTLGTAANTAIGAVNGVMNALNLTGGRNRALNIEQAKFQLSGLGVAWEDVASSIDYAVKGTAYGLDQAAKAASQFVASGVQIGEQMDQALRGISGVAAMTNSDYDEIAQIFTRIAGNGRVFATDLNSIGARGLNATAKLAEYLNTTEAEVKDMVSAGKIDFQMFAEAMDSAFGEHAKKANDTFQGATSNLRAAMGRLWAEFYDKNGDGEDITKGNLLEVMRRMALAVIPIFDNLKKAWAPFYAAFGKYALKTAEVVETLAGGLSKLIYVNKDEVIEYFTPMGDKVTELGEGLTKFGDKLGKVFSIMMDNAMTFVTPFTNAIKSVLPSFVEFLNFLGDIRILNFVSRLKLSSGAMAIFQAAFTGVASVVKGVGSVIFSVISKVTTVMLFLKDIADFAVDSFVAGVQNMIKPFKEGFKSAISQFTSFSDAIKESPFYNSGTMTRLRAVGSTFKDLFEAVKQGTYNFGNYDWGLISQKFSLFSAAVGDLASSIFDKLIPADSPLREFANNVKIAFGNAKQLLTNIPWEKFGRTLGSVFGTVGGKALEGFANLLNGLGTIALDVFGFVGGFFRTTLYPAFSNVGSFGFELLNTAWSAAGTFVGSVGEALGFEGLEDRIGTLQGFVDGLQGSFTSSTFGSGLIRIKDAFGGIFDEFEMTGDMKTAISNFLDEIKIIVEETFADWHPFEGVSEWWEGFKESMQSFGTVDFPGLGTILFPEGSIPQKALDKISQFLSDIWSTLQDILPSWEEISDAGLRFLNDVLIPLAKILGNLAGGAIKALGEAFGFLSEKLGSLISSVDGTGVKEAIGGVFDSLLDFSEKFAAGDFQFPDLSGLLGSAENMLGDFSNFVGGLFPEGFTLFEGASVDKDFIEDLEEVQDLVSKSTGPIGGLHSDMADEFSKDLGAIQTALNNAVDEDAARSLNPIEAFLNGLITLKNKVFELVGVGVEGLSAAISAFGDFWMKFGHEILLVIGVLGTVYSAIKTAKSFSTLSKGIAGFLGSLGSAIKGPVTIAAEGLFRARTKIQQISDLIMSLVILIGAVYLLSKADQDQMRSAIVTLGMLAGVLVVTYGLMTLISTLSASFLTKRGLDPLAQEKQFMGMASLGAALFMAAKSMAVIAKIPEEALWRSLAIVGILSVIMTTAGSLLGHFGASTLKASAGLMVFGLAMSGMIVTLLVLNLVPWSALIESLKKMAVFMGGLLGVIVIISQFGYRAGQAAPMLLAMGVLVGILVGSLAGLTLLARTDDGVAMKKALENLAILALIVGALALVTAMCGMFMTKGAGIEGLLLLSGISMLMGVMAASLAGLALIPNKNMKKAHECLQDLMITMMVMIAVVTLAAVFAGPSELFISRAVLLVGLMAGLALAMAAAVTMMKDVNGADALKSSIGIAILAGAFTAIIAVMTLVAKMNPVSFTQALIGISAGLLVFSASVAIMAHALAVVNEVDWSAVGRLAVMLALFAAVIAAATAITMIPVVGEAFLIALVAITAALIGFGVAMMLAGTGAKAFADSFMTMALSIPVLINGIIYAADKLALAFRTDFIDLVDSIDIFLDHLASKAPDMASNFRKIGSLAVAAIIGVFTDNLGNFAMIPVNALHEIATKITENEDQIGNDIASSLESMCHIVTQKVLPTLTDEVGPMFHQVSQFISENAPAFAADIGHAIGAVIAALPAAIVGIGAGFSEGVVGLSDMFATAFNFDGYTYDETGMAIPIQVDLDSGSVGEATEAIEGVGASAESAAESVESIVPDSFDMSALDGMEQRLSELAADGELTGAEITAAFSDIDVGDFTSTLMSGLSEGFNLDDHPYLKAAAEYFGLDLSLFMSKGLAKGKPFDVLGRNADDALGTIGENIEKFANVNMSSGKTEVAFRSAGKAQGESAAEGFKVGIEPMRTATSAMGAKLRGSLNLYSAFYRSGRDAGRGLIDGLSSMIEAAYKKGAEIGDAANRGARSNKGLNESSPSKKFFESGYYAGQGLILGLESMKSGVEAAGANLGSGASDGLSRTLELASDTLDLVDWDARPVIRPVLDTSDVERGVFFMNSLLTGPVRRQAAFAYGRASVSSPQNQNGSQYNINMTLDYNAGTNPNQIANGIVQALTTKLNLEG